MKYNHKVNAERRRSATRSSVSVSRQNPESARSWQSRVPISAVALPAALALAGVTLSGAAEAQTLGTAASFGVLAGSTVTNTGPSVITGDVGVWPSLAVVGFPPGIVVPPGTIHAGDAVAQQAQSDLTTAFNDLMSRPSQVDLTGQDLGGLILSPAVYSFATSAQLTGVLTLNGQGDPASEFVFQIGSTLTTASNSAVLLVNGANADNVYWVVGSSATLGTNTMFAGNIIALTSITLNTGASINCGRALARNGAVTLDNNAITLCVTGGNGGNGNGDGNGNGNGGDTTLEDIFGEGVSGTQQTAFGASKLFGSAVLGQAAFWLDGAGPDIYGITPQPQRSIKDGSLKDGIFEGGPLYQPRTWRAWATGFGGTTSLDGDPDNGSADLDGRTAGFAAGVDYQIDPTALVGIAGGYTHSRFSVDQRLTSGTVEGAHVGIYGVKRLGPVYVAAAAEYAWYDNNTDRAVDWVVDERHEGSFDSDAYSARLEAGWKRSFGSHRVTPFAGIEVTHLESEGFTETSAAPSLLGLTFASGSVTSLTSSLGVQFDTRIALVGGHTLAPFARLAWVHEFHPDRSVDSSLTASPAASFSPEGAAAPSDLAKVIAGLKLDLNESVGLYAYFDGEFSDRSQSYTGNGGIRIAW